MNKITIATTAFNQGETLKRLLTSLYETTYDLMDMIVLDNGSSEKLEFTVPPRPRGYTMRTLRNEKNLGLYRAYNQIVEAATGDWVAIFHNDVIIHEKGWDTQIKKIVNTLESFGRKIGIVGFAGGAGLGTDGARLGFASNLRGVAENHGRRIEDFMPAAVLDGCVLILNKKMLANVGGFDEKYIMHHIYDYDISMASIMAGYTNLVVGVDFTHQGGVTACAGDFQIQAQALGGEQFIMDSNIQRWREKWLKYMPVTVGDNWRVKIGNNKAA